jgi:hypothetical protein
VEAAVKQAITIHLRDPPGDILIFMTGQARLLIMCVSCTVLVFVGVLVIDWRLSARGGRLTAPVLAFKGNMHCRHPLHDDNAWHMLIR